MSVYAPESKSWYWYDSISLISHNCILFGDFNVDLEKDMDKAETLTLRIDSLFLSLHTPSQPTSLSSDRVIGYVFSAGILAPVQTYKGGTTSDYKPTLSVLPINSK